MGYAWPVDDVMATFRALVAGWHVEPYLAPLYQRWHDVPVEPAHAYNARRLAGGNRGAD